jgi:hypothetical protein
MQSTKHYKVPRHLAGGGCKMKLYTIHCKLSVLGWRILSWREAHKKSKSTWVYSMPTKLSEYLLINKQREGVVPILCEDGLQPAEVSEIHGREWMHSLALGETLVKKTVRGNDAHLTFQVESEENATKDKNTMGDLDAYGHLTWVAGYSDEWRDVGIQTDRGDWLACFDFRVFKCRSRGVMVAYHTVVNSDSGGFIMTAEEGVVVADKAPFDLPDYWTSIGMDDGVQWLDDEIKSANDCQRSWETSLRQEIDRVQGN